MKKTAFLILAALGWIVLNSGYSFAETEPSVFTYRSPESDIDHRYRYDKQLLQLALDSTEATDGPYRLVPSPVMNAARAQSFVEKNTLPNLILKLSYNPAFEAHNMAFVPFPVDLGIVGYRVCFAHPEIVERVSQVESIDDLRKFRHGQGSGWADIEILRHNGFDVTGITSYESLFRMVAMRRFDLFCRGANELLDEFTEHKDIQGLSYDSSMALFYPFPRFFIPMRITEQRWTEYITV